MSTHSLLRGSIKYQYWLRLWCNFSPNSFEAVLLMEHGYRPDFAAMSPIRKIKERFPGKAATVIVGNAQGQFCKSANIVL